MTQNEEMFPDPDTFRPERYIEDPGLPFNFLFGFGRRMCPGMHVAQSSLFMVVAKVLWAFDVWPVVDSSTGACICSFIFFEQLRVEDEEGEGEQEQEKRNDANDLSNRTGNPVLPDPHAFVGGIVIKPVPFPFVLRPREGMNVESVVRSEAGKAEVLLGAYE